MRLIQDIPDLANKKILLRADFDVPVSDSGEIRESFRILKQKEMLDFLVNRGAKVVIIAHASAIDTFRKILPGLVQLLGHDIYFLDSVSDIIKYLENNPTIGLLEDIRHFDGEMRNDDELARQLANGFDYYVNNAFAVSHRSHASVSAITKFLPSYAGLQLAKEVEELQKSVAAPAAGKVVIIGGAKAATKIPVIQNFLDKADTIILGGVVANDVLHAKGVDVGMSKTDDNLAEVIGTLDLKSDKLILPHDFNMLENKIMDIGPHAIEKFEDIVRRSSMIIWNGPMGLFEDATYAKGTEAVARAVISSGAPSIVGGGDTIAAVNQIGLLDKFTFVSTGGGAMLEFLAGKNMPGISVLL